MSNLNKKLLAYAISIIQTTGFEDEELFAGDSWDSIDLLDSHGFDKEDIRDALNNYKTTMFDINFYLADEDDLSSKKISAYPCYRDEDDYWVTDYSKWIVLFGENNGSNE
jgi:hypothetical protein